MKAKMIKYTVTIITIAITIFIFSMSLRPASQSDEISLETTKVAVGIWSWLPFFNWESETMQELAYSLNPLMRKMAHFAEFALLGISAFMTTKLYMPAKRIQVNVGAAFGYCVLIATMDEILQLFVDGRNGNIGDVVLDSAGAICGTLFVMLYIRLRKRGKMSK